MATQSKNVSCMRRLSRCTAGGPESAPSHSTAGGPEAAPSHSREDSRPLQEAFGDRRDERVAALVVVEIDCPEHRPAEPFVFDDIELLLERFSIVVGHPELGLG